MSKKTASIFGATGTAGVACVNEFINHELFRDRVEPFVAAMRAGLIASGDLPPDSA
jgi:hypothetical protein